MVRTVPRHRPDPRRGREGIRRKSARGEGQRGRQSRHRLAVRSAGDPDAHPLQGRPDQGADGRRQSEIQHRFAGAEEPLRTGALTALIVSLLLLAGCGPKAITVGSRPFPAGRAVFTDTSGKALNALPTSAEPVGLVFLDFPWCPACADVWRAVRFSATPFPRGTVRVYRVLFDRETVLSPAGRRGAPPLPRGGGRVCGVRFDREPVLSPAGRREAPPLRPAPPPGGGDDPEDAGTPEITTLTALPGEFQEEFRLSHAPVLLLLDPDGKVARRWIGYSVGMSRELASEIRKRFRAPSLPPPGT